MQLAWTACMDSWHRLGQVNAAGRAVSLSRGAVKHDIPGPPLPFLFIAYVCRPSMSLGQAGMLHISCYPCFPPVTWTRAHLSAHTHSFYCPGLVACMQGVGYPLQHFRTEKEAADETWVRYLSIQGLPLDTPVPELQPSIAQPASIQRR